MKQNIVLHDTSEMNMVKIIFCVLAIVVGILLVIYSGYDDSPGGQLIGLVTVILGIVGAIRNKKNNSVT